MNNLQEKHHIQKYLNISRLVLLYRFETTFDHTIFVLSQMLTLYTYRLIQILDLHDIATQHGVNLFEEE